MFIVLWAGVPITLINNSLILIVGTGSLLVIRKKRTKEIIDSALNQIRLPKISLLDLLLIVGIASLIGYSIFSSLYSPVDDWDSIVLYDFRAKVLLNETYFRDVLHSWNYFWGYPLLTSLAHLWIYLLGGKSPVFIYPLFYLSFILMFYGTIRRFSSRTISLVAALLPASDPLIFYQSMIAYTNIPYTFYLVSGSIYVFLWAKTSKKEYLILGGLLSGLSTWTRSVEPFWLANLIFVWGYSFYKKRYGSLVLYPFIFLLIQYPWRIFQKVLLKIPYTTEQIGTSLSILLKNLEIQRISLVLSYLYSSVFVTWGAGAILFVLTVLIGFFKQGWKRNYEFLIIIFINLLLLFLGTYILSFGSGTWIRIPDSAKRMSMFFIPMFDFYIFSSQIVGQMWRMRGQKIK
jgi:4-amino-4-deoxy-L-arabinose transferase-like glycosyltransferase